MKSFVKKIMFLLIFCNSTVTQSNPPPGPASSEKPATPPKPAPPANRRLKKLGAIAVFAATVPPTKKEATALIAKYKAIVKEMDTMHDGSMLAQFIFWADELKRALAQANLRKAFNGLCKFFDRYGIKYTKDVIATKLLIVKQSELSPAHYFELLQAAAGYAASHTFKLASWVAGSSKHAEIRAKYLQEIENLQSYVRS